MQNYKDLLVWQKAHRFTLKMYAVVSAFPKEETYNLTSQIKRSASSIGSNIAEGCGRFTSKNLASFLQIALGSTHELEYQLLLSKDLKFIDEELFIELEKEVGEIKAMLISLIKKVRLAP
ncbi:four helix bundle protein [Pedobacter montanisoli]|uniref:Four helix bundle protein n=1 Tax=Pedobacter montanisoli TaxID=2923277 RepID=A0ABS9ZTN6_9SPHI|nr:four helix bundle protein [Pedobacter montanisoli]MCJ0741873.1 four helix bundle protein [Pedobacter montanisoli]